MSRSGIIIEGGGVVDVEGKALVDARVEGEVVRSDTAEEGPAAGATVELDGVAAAGGTTAADLMRPGLRICAGPTGDQSKLTNEPRSVRELSCECG